MTQKQKAVLQCLLTSNTRAEAAERAGVDPKTIYRYFQDEEFITEYKRRLDELISDAVRQGQQSISPALSILRELGEDIEQPGHIRVAACKAILEHAERLTELYNLSGRVLELETKWRESNEGAL